MHKSLDLPREWPAVNEVLTWKVDEDSPIIPFVMSVDRTADKVEVVKIDISQCCITVRDGYLYVYPRS